MLGSAKTAAPRAWTVRAVQWPRRNTEYHRTGKEGKQSCLPRGCKFAGPYKGCVRQKQIPSLGWFSKSRYNTPGKNAEPHLVCFEQPNGATGSVQRPHILPRANARDVSIARRRGRIWGLRDRKSVV